MNGAEALLRTAAAAGVSVCFANPGTTELPLVAALDAVPAIRPVPCLQEAVVAGAADGYGRVARSPALALLHLGPGLANALSQLHDARRARTPVLAVVGEHATFHRSLDSPITMDVVAMARVVADEVIVADDPRRLAATTAAALATCGRSPGRVVVLVVPADVQWGEAGKAAVETPPAEGDTLDEQRVATVAAALRDAAAAVLLLGNDGLTGPSLRAAARVAAGTGAVLWTGTFPSCLARGGDLPAPSPLPYPPPAARAVLDVPLVVLVGERAPVAMFGRAGEDGHLIAAGTRVLTLAGPEEPAAAALEALAALVGTDPPRRPRAIPRRPAGRLDPETLAAAVAAVQPEGAIVVDEGVTSTRSYLAASAAAPPHRYLRLTGGALGFGLPAALGAALAAPGHPVIDLQADGSAAYALPALWSQAREHVNVTTVLCDNGGYRILRIEMGVAGMRPGAAAAALLDFDAPIDWVELAAGLGVEGTVVEDAGALADAVARSVADPGPGLVVARL